jgi:hypothetical protein
MTSVAVLCVMTSVAVLCVMTSVAVPVVTRVVTPVATVAMGAPVVVPVRLLTEVSDGRNRIDGRAGDRNTSRSGDSEPDHGQQGETHDQRATFSGHGESPHDRRNGSSGVNRSRRFQATGKGIGAQE